MADTGTSDVAQEDDMEGIDIRKNMDAVAGNDESASPYNTHQLSNAKF